MADNPTTKIGAPVWVLLTIGCIVLLFIRFCPSMPRPIVDNAAFKQLQQRVKEDSMRTQRLNDSLFEARRVTQARVSAQRDSMQHVSDSLTSIIKRNYVLIAKYKNTTGSAYPIDTSATLVPQEFLNDCEECFTQLEKTNVLANNYKTESEQLMTLHLDQARIDSMNIANLQQQRLQLYKDYNDARMMVQSYSSTPKRALLVGVAGYTNPIFLPKGVGPSILYLDRQSRAFGFTPLFGNSEPLYVAKVLVPLFKFK